ncbi:hypothetical protein [Agrobacterium tumefaciens]|uniref:hypothetical protein n=1 Tax=Agrobacterium tumefaciens TaxID=358 RepID=UPI00287C29E2|nr:hypothetical protein [Agrobacterium tumefaciens]MDS7598109.1 hypothetical protein [Agrobacterium tumefaciens]
MAGLQLEGNIHKYEIFAAPGAEVFRRQQHGPALFKILVIQYKKIDFELLPVWHVSEKLSIWMSTTPAVGVIITSAGPECYDM